MDSGSWGRGENEETRKQKKIKTFKYLRFELNFNFVSSVNCLQTERNLWKVKQKFLSGLEGRNGDRTLKKNKLPSPGFHFLLIFKLLKACL